MKENGKLKNEITNYKTLAELHTSITIYRVLQKSWAISNTIYNGCSFKKSTYLPRYKHVSANFRFCFGFFVIFGNNDDLKFRKRFKLAAALV